MLHKHLFLISTAALICVGIAVLVGCHPHGAHCGHQGFHEKMPVLLQKMISVELELTDEQEALLEDIVNDVADRHREMEGEHGVLFDAVLSEVRSDGVDQDKLNSLFEGKESRIPEMRSFLIGKFTEFHGILTLDQREKLAEHMMSCREKMHPEGMER